MKKAILILCNLLISISLLSQAPGIRWQQSLGGAGYDHFRLLTQTIDNGFIGIGLTNSIDGNFISNHGNLDVWVEKFDANGISQWRRILGGSQMDVPVSFVYNPDGSIVVLCTTTSVNGDITNNHGARDIWVFKLDGAGRMTWQKCYGGSSNESGAKILKSINGGYVISGITSSNNGDVSNYHGNVDAWVIKINEGGTLIWQKTLGGSSGESYDEPVEDEFVNFLVEASDGSIYLALDTDSNDNDVSGNHGLSDIWLCKLNGLGIIQWQKSLGGTGSEHASEMKLDVAGNVYIVGSTDSPELPFFHTVATRKDDVYFCKISPNSDLLLQKCFGGLGKDYGFEIVNIDVDGNCVLSSTINNGGGDVVGYHNLNDKGFCDLWIINIDSQGNIIWQKTLGGFDDEELWGEHLTNSNVITSDIITSLGGVIKTTDGGYLVTSYTESNDGDVSGFHQTVVSGEIGSDIWMVKLSSVGQLEWQRSLGGMHSEVPKCPALELSANNFIIAGTTNGRDGEVQNLNGYWDLWLVNLGAANRIKGTVFIDQNGNGQKDLSDSLFSDVYVNASKLLNTKTAIPYKGNFIIETDTGIYNTSLQVRPYYIINPVSHTSSFSTYFNTDSFSFALQPIPGKKDLEINIVPINPARSGFDLTYNVLYRNAGTEQIPSGQVLFIKDSRINFVSATPSQNTIIGDTLKWSFSNLNPLEERNLLLKFHISEPPVLILGDTLSSSAIISPVVGDITPSDDTAKLRQRVQGSYDPNDKAENVGGSITLDRVLQGEYLRYFIRFQNTGTDTAFNVVVRDTLETDLDWNTFEMISSSHAYQLQLLAPNILEWTFYGINLPDSNVNELASHGYIAYRIKLAAGATIGTTVMNRASIYFDFNLPVPTNFAATIVGTPITLPLHLLTFDANYHKPDAVLEWSTADESNVGKFVIERGTDPVHFAPIGIVAARNGTGVTHYQFKDGLASTSGDKFYYRLKMMDIDQKFSYSNIQLVKKEGRAVNELLVNPNPIKGRFGFAWINLQKEARAEIGAVDMKGNYRILSQQQINKGFNVVPLDFFGLSDGTYLLQVKIGQERLISRFVLVQ